VKPGDSLFSIAQTYGTTAEEIATVNQLPNPNNLVVGQALVIPVWGRYYVVQPGDSLWSIGQRLGINYVTIAEMNGIDPNSPLIIGTYLFIPPAPKVPAEILAYVEPRGETISEVLINEVRNTGPYLTYLALFSFEANRDGTLTAPTIEPLPTIATEANTSIAMVITNLEDYQFSSELARDIFQSEAVQNLLLDNIIQEARSIGNISDIHFDLERIPGDQRVAYNNFLRKAVERLHAEGFTVSTALAPKTRADQPGEWYEAHDYESHGEIVDFSLLMTYEWGYSGGPPMAVSPINEVEKVVNFALSVMPAEKIMLGQNLYGYDWTLPFVQGGEYATAVSPQRAIELASRYNAVIQYDDTAQAPYFNYVDEEGRSHVVWFEDARSIQAKFDMIKRLGLRGIGYWKLGLPFPQNWVLIDANFDVEKK
jgi:spore germination protein